jgi:putative ABC transport system ATP-binding protein
VTQTLIRQEIDIAPAARARGLAKQYRRGAEVVRALDGVDLTLERGEFAAVVGPSGSGKSTLMNLLGCMDRPTAGRLWIAGEEVAGLADAALTRMRRAHLGFIFQQFHLLPTLTVLENVLLPATFGGAGTRGAGGRQASGVRRDRRCQSVANLSGSRLTPDASRLQRAKALLERVGLSARLHHRPSQLSGGEMQRVAIARSLINDPELLLADEPTGNLDTEASAVVLDLFRGLNAEGLTVVLVTHNPELAASTRRIIRLRDGRIVEDVRG